MAGKIRITGRMNDRYNDTGQVARQGPAKHVTSVQGREVFYREVNPQWTAHNTSMPLLRDYTTHRHNFSCPAKALISPVPHPHRAPRLVFLPRYMTHGMRPPPGISPLISPVPMMPYHHHRMPTEGGYYVPRYAPNLRHSEAPVHVNESQRGSRPVVGRASNHRSLDSTEDMYSDDEIIPEDSVSHVSSVSQRHTQEHPSLGSLSFVQLDPRSVCHTSLRRSLDTDSECINMIDMDIKEEPVESTINHEVVDNAEVDSVSMQDGGDDDGDDVAEADVLQHKQQKETMLVKNWSVKYSRRDGSVLVISLRGQDMMWRSSKVEKRERWDLVITESGRAVQLQGPIHPQLSQNLGLSEKIVTAFKNGFPDNWKALLQQWQEESESEGEDSESEESDAESDDGYSHDAGSDSDSLTSMDVFADFKDKQNPVASQTKSMVTAKRGRKENKAGKRGHKVKSPIRKAKSTMAKVYIPKAKTQKKDSKLTAKHLKQATMDSKHTLKNSKQAPKDSKLKQTSKISKQTKSSKTGKQQEKSQHPKTPLQTKDQKKLATEEKEVSLAELPQTRSGRRVKPVLAWWASQRVFVNGEVVEILCDASPAALKKQANFSFTNFTVSKEGKAFLDLGKTKSHKGGHARNKTAAADKLKMKDQDYGISPAARRSHTRSQADLGQQRSRSHGGTSQLSTRSQAGTNSHGDTRSYRDTRNYRDTKKHGGTRQLSTRSQGHGSIGPKKRSRKIQSSQRDSDSDTHLSKKSCMTRSWRSRDHHFEDSDDYELSD